MCPERHLEASQLLGSEVQNPKKADAGQITADVVRKYMHMVTSLACIQTDTSFTKKKRD